MADDVASPQLLTVPNPVTSYSADLCQIESSDITAEMKQLAASVTESQLKQIRNQIRAFQYIKKSEAIPPELLVNVSGLEVAIKERDAIIKKQLTYRAEMLRQTLGDLTGKEKLKGEIELKGISLVEFQRQVRSEVTRGMNLGVCSVGRRVKRTTLSDGRVGERLERDTRIYNERMRLEEHNQWLGAVMGRLREMREEWKRRQIRMAKINKGVLNYHATSEREQKREEERNRRERIRRLMAEDEVGYRKLLDQNKDKRLTYLLQQTDEYINGLARLLGGDNEVRKLSDSDEYGGSQMNYYSLAHSQREKIETQPVLGGTLKPYQMAGLEWMTSLYNNNLNGILADEMGLGKTIQTIALVAHLHQRKNIGGPHLIVVPLSTLSNWINEFSRWAPNLTVLPYRGPPQERRVIAQRMRMSSFNVLVTTYDYIIKDKNTLSKTRWCYLVVDEGHRMKNHHCKLTQILSSKYHVPHRLLLTGTPLQNRLPELWSLLNFILPNIFKSCANFEQWFNAPFASTNEKVELDQEESLLVIRRLHLVLRPFLLRRLKKEVEGQLPEKVEYIIKCPLSCLQRILYTCMEKNGILLTLDEKSKVAGRTLSNTLMQLRKICNHPFLFGSIEQAMSQQFGFGEEPVHGPLLFRVSGKFEILDRILPKLRETGHKCLVFCQMTSLMNILEDYLNYRNFSHLRLDGSTKAEDREFLLSQFNDPKLNTFIFLLSTRAGGLGLNLQTADTVIIFDSDWNPHQDLQAEDRAHRIGQLRQVRVLRLITVKSVEERIISAAKSKLNMDDKIIRAGMFNQKSTSDERKQFLQSLLDQDDDELEDADLVHDDEALNNMLTRSSDEFELFMKMDRARAESDRENNILSRLITEDELPKWLLDASKMEYIEEETICLGLRQRKNQEVYEADPWTQTRSRRRRVVEEDDSLSEDEVVSRPKRSSKSSSNYDLFNQLLDFLIDYVDGSGRPLIDPFLELPSKRELPDYYEVIKKPMDVKRIRNRMRLKKYASLQDFSDDVILMFNNAQVYNVEESLIFEDAVALAKVFLEKKLELSAPYML